MSLATTRLAAPVSMHGRPLGVDLTTTRSLQAQRFFERLLGWTFSARPHLALVPDRDDDLAAFLDQVSTPSHTIARCYGELVAEFISDEAHPASAKSAPAQCSDSEWSTGHHSVSSDEQVSSLWVPQIAVDDLGLVLALVDAAGGTVLEAPHSRGDAWVATIADPGGARLSVWQAPPDGLVLDGDQLGTLRNGRLQWIELESADVASAVRFYRAVFGWEAHDENDVDGAAYTVFTSGGTPVAGSIASMLPGVADSWCPSFAVVDTDAAVSSAVGLGAVVLAEPADMLVGRQAVLVDPTGGICGVVGPRPSGFCPL
jgi:predicted enzyme related to lactoylglutathione lyase